tara:strand:- start:587 stop:1780 length:1194 start_codon:yes stop_codon:yes gene_type:complete
MFDIPIIWVFAIALVITYVLYQQIIQNMLASLKVRARRKKLFLDIKPLLYSDQSSLEFDALLESLAPFSDDVQGRLVAGSLARRRGDVQASIRIHRKLLDKGSYSSFIKEQVQIELAKDYVAAGLYDRAEALLEEFIGSASSLEPLAIDILLELQLEQKNWERAAEIGEPLAAKRPGIGSKLAHFYCELADMALEYGDTLEAVKYAKKAKDYDTKSPRVSILQARILVRQRNFLGARSLLRIIGNQFPHLSDQVLDIFFDSCEGQGEEGDRDYLNYVLECIGHLSPERLIQAFEFCISSSKGSKSVVEQLIRRLAASENEYNLVLLIKCLRKFEITLDPEYFNIILGSHTLAENINLPFRCKECGFGSRAFIWLCPSCHSWESIRLDRSLSQSRSQT